MTRKPSLCFWACLLWPLLWPSAVAQTTLYDQAFRRWGSFYAPFEDWHWFKAQAVAESGLNPAAVSACGARGIMQLMPATAKALGAVATDPESAIQGGVKYDRSLWDLWKTLASSDERRRFMFASYNAGPGNIQRAARRTRDPTWACATKALPSVTGAHATETIGYVARIETIFRQLQ